jgi:hypothetical protein
MKQQHDEDAYYEGMETIYYMIKTYGARACWKDLKVFHPKEYKELLLAALEELPK